MPHPSTTKLMLTKTAWRRRDWWRLMTAQAATLGWMRAFAGQGPSDTSPTLHTLPPRWTSNPFALGVASGSPRAHSVVIWTRLHLPPDQSLPPEVSLTWQVAEDAKFATMVHQGAVIAQARHGHSAHIKVEGLRPARTYFYRFISGEAISTVGRTRTAPAPNAQVDALKLAWMSCQHYEQGYFAGHADVAARDLDLVVFLGDYIYETNKRGTFGSAHVREHETTATPTTLSAYRQRYALYKADPQLQLNHASHPWLVMWDDHEVENDYAADQGRHRQSPEFFLQQRAAAYQAFFENMPVDPSHAPAGEGLTLHGRWTWGRLADIWTLDERQFRSGPSCDRGIGKNGSSLVLDCDDFNDPKRTMLGAEQGQWLKSGLADSKATWQVLAHGTPLSPQGWDTPAGRLAVSDSWEAFAAARHELLMATTQASTPNPVFLCGDVHRHVAAHLRPRPNDPTSPIVACEFTTSSVTSKGLPSPMIQALANSNPDLLHARGDQRGHGLLHLTPRELNCTLMGTPHPVANPKAAYSVQARFRVAAGQARVEKA